ncbi:hypothetical protein NHG32_01965 [Aerococcaceae bacterium NML191219]|nr:hypothetical protein [Aerococcaceae bacterium NML191219]
MLTIKELFEQADSVKFPHYEIVRVPSLLELCRKVDFKMTPFDLTVYYYDQKVYEMYLYDLRVVSQDELPFEEWVVEATHAKDYESISERLLYIRQHTYIRLSDDNEWNKQQFIRHLEFLLSYPDISDEIRKLYSNYSPDNLYVELYEF